MEAQEPGHVPLPRWVTPVLALTACGNPKRDHAFAEYLSKPIDPIVLAQAVRRAVTR